MLPDVSILEFGVAAFVGYSALLMLIISIIKEIPMNRSMSITRSVYILLGTIMMFMIAGQGLDFKLETERAITNSTLLNNTGTLISTTITNTTTTNTITLMNYPAWVLMHYMFGIVMAFFFILQIATLMTKTD